MVAENCQSKNPYFEGRIVLFVIIFSFDLFFVVFVLFFKFIYISYYNEIKKKVKSV